MTFDDLADAALKREMRAHGAAYPFEAWHYALGLAGDAGEIADKVKNMYRDAGGNLSRVPQTTRDVLLHELGDELLYVNALAVKLGRSLDDVARVASEKPDPRRPLA